MYDTHAHLDFDVFDSDRDLVLERAAQVGVNGILAVGIDLATSLNALKLASAHDQVEASAAIHPNSTAAPETEAGFARIREMVLDGTFVAGGETGLDNYWDKSPPETQERYFRKHIDLALEAGKPLIIHCREAHDRTLAILKEYHERGGLPCAVMHCFGAPARFAGIFSGMGLYISFAGNVTYKNARELHEAAAKVPIDLLLAETDCPFLAPVPCRGKRNEPALMAHTVRRLAEIRGIEVEEMSSIVDRNARRFLFDSPEN